MSRQNRVTPLGELIATTERGLVYGNRGCLHDDAGHVRRAYNGRRWIACVLEFRGRHRPQLMAPGRYTELFFLDEATALAAGHRPCAECRRADYRHLVDVLAERDPSLRGADAIDAELHGERLVAGTGERRVHEAVFDELPDGTFVRHHGKPCLVLGEALLTWSPAGYVARVARPARQPAAVITPPSLIALLRTRRTPLVPLVHPTAHRG